MTDQKTGLDLLREPFPANQINKLPKPYKADSPKGRCNECGGFHGLPAVHLDYVGHAALTARLLDADPEWSWDFVATDPTTGMPVFDQNGGLWIRLTVCGVTRLGYGDAQGKRGGNAVKEAIGDALRNAGMRFGAALDLWHKGDLYDASEELGTEPDPEPTPKAQKAPRGWKDKVQEAVDVEGLTGIYKRAEADGWLSDEVVAALGVRKKQLQSDAPRNDPPPAWRAMIANASSVDGVRALRTRAEGAGWLAEDVAAALDAREAALYEVASAAEFDAAVENGEV